MMRWQIRSVERGVRNNMAASTICVSKPHDMDPYGGVAWLLGEEESGRLRFDYPVMGGGRGIVTEVITLLGDRSPGDEVLIEAGEPDAEGRTPWELCEVVFPADIRPPGPVSSV